MGQELSAEPREESLGSCNSCDVDGLYNEQLQHLQGYFEEEVMSVLTAQLLGDGGPLVRFGRSPEEGVLWGTCFWEIGLRQGGWRVTILPLWLWYIEQRRYAQSSSLTGADH